jgi:hypothetical protein
VCDSQRQRGLPRAGQPADHRDRHRDPIAVVAAEHLGQLGDLRLPPGEVSNRRR